MSPRPNILLIFTDQQSANVMSCTGNAEISTPSMDSLAAEGVRFERAYCATPSCAPTRNSIMTGTLPHEIKFDEGRIANPAATLGRVLSASGYDCQYAGNRSFALGKEPEVCGFQPLSDALDADMAVDCRDFLLERGKEDAGEPFFLVASFINPHNICQWAREQNTYLGAIEERHIPDCPCCPPITSRSIRTTGHPLVRRDPCLRVLDGRSDRGPQLVAALSQRLFPTDRTGRQPHRHCPSGVARQRALRRHARCFHQ